MAPEQMDLFSSMPAWTVPMARGTDPPTSHAAAASMTPEALGAQLRSVLWALDHHSNHGTRPGGTAHEVVMVLAYGSVPAPQQSVVARRLTDLRERGLIRDTGTTRPGASNRELTVWELTDQGRKAL